MGGAYGYIMPSFAKAPQVTSTEAMTEFIGHRVKLTEVDPGLINRPK